MGLDLRQQSGMVWGEWDHEHPRADSFENATGPRPHGRSICPQLRQDDDQRRELELFFSQEVFSRPYIMSPGVPAERVAAMRKAFADTLADPELLTEAKKAHLEVSPVSGEEVEQLIAKVYDAPKPLVAKVKAALQP